MPGIAISSGRIDNPNKLAAVIEQALDEADIETDDIDVHTGTYHEDWNNNGPCPSCGTERFVVPTVNHEVYTLDENNDQVFHEKTDDVEAMLGFFCNECDEFIMRVPYSELL